MNSSFPPSFRQRPVWRPNWKVVVLTTLVALVLWCLVMLGLAAAARGAEEEDPFVHALVPLVWQARPKDGGVLYNAVVPYARVHRHALKGGTEGVGIAFENGFACTATVTPKIPFSMTCGGLDEFYALKRLDSGVWQMTLMKRKDSVEIPDDPPKIRS